MNFTMYLDDIRKLPNSSWVLARNYDDFRSIIMTNGCPNHISFDHDLGANQESGFDAAKWLVNQDLNYEGKFIPEDFTFNVHSMNPVGHENIKKLLLNYLEFRNV